jgi:phenylalanine-4-hydroxylase
MITDINDPLNPSVMELDPKHPGLNDAHYIQRRTYFFDLAREYRLANKGIPLVTYEPEEHEIWRIISEKLAASHEKNACAIFLEGKKKLGLDTEHMPQLYDLDQRLRKEHCLGIVPAEGLLHTRTFFSYLSQGMMPCTQFIRHGATPEYTPEPDAVHDVIGHIPCLMNKEFSEIVQLIGQGVAKANDSQLDGWSRVYWFSIEFGMIQENDALKVFGAGILSSFGEMEYCYSDQVTRKPFDLNTVINTPYDPTRMQDTIFIIPSMTKLKQDVLQLMEWYR